MHWQFPDNRKFMHRLLSQNYFMQLEINNIGRELKSTEKYNN